MRRSALWLTMLAAPCLAAAERAPPQPSAAALRSEQARLAAERDAAEAARAQREQARSRQIEQAAAAEVALARALAQLGPTGGDGLSVSARAALAAAAAAEQQAAQANADRLEAEAAALAAREAEVAEAMARLEAEARTREAEARRAREAEARARKAAAAAARRAEITRTPGRRTPGTPRDAAVTVALVEGGGRVLRAFGAQTAGGPPSSGITLDVQPRALVLAPRAGRVIHTGALRDGGHVLILEVGQGYLLVFAGLGELFAAKGASLQQGDRLGAAPGLDSSTVYFEVRRGGVGVDPLTWLAAGR